METITTTKQSSIEQQSIYQQQKQPQQHSIQQQLGKGQHILKRSSILPTGLVEHFFTWSSRKVDRVRDLGAQEVM